MEITNYFISFIIGALFTLIVFLIRTITEDKKTTEDEKAINNVHFYVARDRDNSLWLFIGKPIRFENNFACSQVLASSYKFRKYGLNKKDYDNLKWEDEPIEVFINMGN